MNLAAPCASASTAPAPRLFHVVALEPPLVAGRRATVDMVRVGRSVLHVQALLPPVFQEARRRGTIACSTESLPTKTRPSDRSDRPPILRRAHIALKCLSLYLKHRDLEFSLLYIHALVDSAICSVPIQSVLFSARHRAPDMSSSAMQAVCPQHSIEAGLRRLSCSKNATCPPIRRPGAQYSARR